MIPEKKNLEDLAKAYIHYLIHRDENPLKHYLSLNFLTRQKATKQLRMIKTLPKLLYGVSMEIHLFDRYEAVERDGNLKISPFQFDLSYTPHMSLVELEKITITINSVRLEKDKWKIESIISDDECDVLTNVIEEMKEKAQIK